MSFEQKALELLQGTEMALGSLITDALRVRAYRDVAAIAEMAEAMAATRRGQEGLQPAPATVAVAAGSSPTPSWMRRP